MSTPALNPLVTKVRGMHPGAYDDMDDATLTKAVLKKYPQYSDLAVPPASSMPGAPSTQPMEMDRTGQVDPLQSSKPNPKLNIAKSAENMPEYVGATGALGAGVMGAAALQPAVAPAAGYIAKQMAAHPVLGPTIASYLISKAREIPGIGHLVPSGAEIVPFLVGHGKGAPEAPPTNPGAPLPEITPELRQATGLRTGGSAPPPEPAAGLGKIPVRGSIGSAMADSAKAPEIPKPPFERGNLGRLLNESVGAAPPPDPKAPIYQRGQIGQQMKTATAAPTDVLEGHTAHQSSALRSSKYDPAAKEFHARYSSGDNTVHVFGDVAPEEADAFNQADSKGKAMQQIKNSHPLVAKIVNGKRLPVKVSQ